MISIYCGDDTVASRASFVSRVDEARRLGGQIANLTLDDLAHKCQAETSAAQFSLWGEKSTYIAENLLGPLKRRLGRDFKQILQDFATKTSDEVVIYEARSSYDLGISTYKWKFVHESKPSTNVFELVASFAPGNKQRFLAGLEQVLQTHPAEFVYTMLMRHLKLALKTMTKAKIIDNPYTIAQARSTAQKFKDQAQLESIYLRLLKYELSFKSGHSFFGARQFVEIVASFML